MTRVSTSVTRGSREFRSTFDEVPVSRASFTAAAFLLLLNGLIWLPALQTPFWGDDYLFLQGARAANLSGESWLAPFWPEDPVKFWRPLSQESYWRVVDLAVAADAWKAHLLNLCLLILASCGVGVLGATIARTCEWTDPLGTGVLGGLLYGSLAIHLLPVHWVSAANSSLLALLTALALAAWISAPGAGRVARPLLLAGMLLLLAAALLSKESAVMTPLLMLALSLFVAPRARPERIEWAFWIACWVIVAVWLAARSTLTGAADAQYQLTIGANLIRNLMSLFAWLLNVPRESMRLIVSDQPALGASWAIAVALLMLGAWAIAAWSMRHGMRGRQMLAAVAFIFIAYGPYFPLAWNSYAYYAAVAAILPAIIMARGLVGSRFAVAGVVLAGLSSLIAVQGTRWLEHPGLIGRAHWAESTFNALEQEKIKGPLLVRRADEQRFYAMGAAGLAWRLGIDPSQVVVVETCPDSADRCLSIDADGLWSWESPPRGRPVENDGAH
jgi:hypothetical protein